MSREGRRTMGKVRESTVHDSAVKKLGLNRTNGDKRKVIKFYKLGIHETMGGPGVNECRKNGDKVGDERRC